MGRALLRPSMELPPPPRTLVEAVELLRPLNERAIQIKKQQLELHQQKHWETRVRTAHGIEGPVAICQMKLRVLGIAESGQLIGRSTSTPSKEVEVDFAKLVGFTGDDIEAAKALYTNAAKMELLLIVQFQVDRMMADLLRALSLTDFRSYEVNARRLLDESDIDAPVTKAAWMYLPSLIRNTMHNGGIHGLGNRSVTVGATRYDSRRNRVFEQAGWNHIVHALSAELDVLDELFQSDRMTNLGSVPDRFAFWQLNGYAPRKAVYTR